MWSPFSALAPTPAIRSLQSSPDPAAMWPAGNAAGRPTTCRPCPAEVFGRARALMQAHRPDAQRGFRSRNSKQAPCGARFLHRGKAPQVDQ